MAQDNTMNDKKINQATCINAQVKATALRDRLTILNWAVIFKNDKTLDLINQCIKEMSELNAYMDSLTNEYFGENQPVSDIAAQIQSNFVKEDGD